MTPGRYKAIRCGRRWGKTDLGKSMAASSAIRGKRVGWFAPDYKRLSEAFIETLDLIKPVEKSHSVNSGMIRTTTGGSIEWWTLKDISAGRSRKYHLVILDEAAFAESEVPMMEIWDKAIQPTLLDYMGRAVVMSNTNGIDPDNFFWQICNEPKHGFVQFHAPTSQNPYMPKAEIEKLRRTKPPLVFKQEYEAEFIDWSGVAFFALTNLLTNNKPVEWPTRCDAVYATIDTATKTGKENDGTAVIYWAVNKFYQNGAPLQILDYNISQVAGDILEVWLGTVFQTLEEYAKLCGARNGSIGAWLEDRSSGMVLLQQSHRRNWPAHEIDSKLTAVGKSERAISVSGYVYQNQVKLTQNAFDKVVNYKENSRNHLLSQIIGFRVGNKEQAEDDLLDTFTYGVAIGLGDSSGF